MNQIKKAGIVIAGVVVAAGIVWGLCGKKVNIKQYYSSLYINITHFIGI